MKRKIILFLFIIFVSPLAEKSNSGEWYIYEHDLTTENLNHMDRLMQYACGDNGVVLRCLYPIDTIYEPEWEDISPLTSEDLYGAESCIGDFDFVIGSNGIILYIDGYTWYFYNSPTTEDLYSVTFQHGDVDFIVGANGTILIGETEIPSWEIYEPSPTNQNLYSVHGDSYEPNSTWAVGAGGTILDYEDGTWILYPSSPTSEDLFAVYVYNENLALACGAKGTILYWNGTSWSLANTPTNENLYSIFGKYYDLMLCVGANGTILVSGDGQNWYFEDCPVDVDLHGVGGYIPIWAVGDGGTILSRDWCQSIQPSSLGQVKAIFSGDEYIPSSSSEIKCVKIPIEKY